MKDRETNAPDPMKRDVPKLTPDKELKAIRTERDFADLSIQRDGKDFKEVRVYFLAD